ncbi:hypothetical protein ARTSIC4J27_560 [Pseudarthrobacter siccitolerans]|uniref:Uncharacterized protein n=2 Tax=Pseudarthrobacter siccitolerans TaxID=861266 RepID=A0A024GXZ0_9MICC|nr:hypothetical protein ARTSIC4J27_560 [Pseudarthrobacter siccitolerans]
MTAAKTFRPVTSNKDLFEALEDGYARLTGDVYETSVPRLVDVAFATNTFGDGDVVKVMRVSRATARRLGLAA